MTQPRGHVGTVTRGQALARGDMLASWYVDKGYKREARKSRNPDAGG